MRLRLGKRKIGRLSILLSSFSNASLQPNLGAEDQQIGKKEEHWSVLLHHLVFLYSSCTLYLITHLLCFYMPGDL